MDGNSSKPLLARGASKKKPRSGGAEGAICLLSELGQGRVCVNTGGWHPGVAEHSYRALYVGGLAKFSQGFLPIPSEFARCVLVDPAERNVVLHAADASSSFDGNATCAAAAGTSPGPLIGACLQVLDQFGHAPALFCHTLGRA